MHWTGDHPQRTNVHSRDGHEWAREGVPRRGFIVVTSDLKSYIAIPPGNLGVSTWEQHRPYIPHVFGRSELEERLQRSYTQWSRSYPEIAIYQATYDLKEDKVETVGNPIRIRGTTVEEIIRELQKPTE